MPDAAWKQAERDAAAWFGTTRKGPTGDDGSDFENDNFSVQVKYRQKLPKWILGALDNAIRSCNETQIGLAVLRQKRQRQGDMLVVIRLEDFASLIDLKGVLDE